MAIAKLHDEAEVDKLSSLAFILLFSTVNEDTVTIVDCSLKFPGEDWFYGEICMEEACFMEDMNNLAFDDSVTDIIPEFVTKL